MKNVIVINKQIGETPLEALEKARIINSIPSDVPMTYAGRLDPLAEGLLIILVGEECKNKEEYNAQEKEYEMEILFGIQTDSFDLLGLITKIDPHHEGNFDFNQFICKYIQEYPAYSSKVIAMKEIPEVLPTNEVEIFDIKEMEERQITGEEIVREAKRKINLVKGDFRQEKILDKWKEFLKQNEHVKFKIMKIKVICSSGTYMRSLANTVGGLAYTIKRTRVGEFTL